MSKSDTDLQKIKAKGIEDELIKSKSRQQEYETLAAQLKKEHETSTAELKSSVLFETQKHQTIIRDLQH